MRIPNWLAVFRALTFGNGGVSSRRRCVRTRLSVETLEYRLYLSAVAPMPSVNLQNDTGTAGDDVTTDPSLAGSLSTDGNLIPVYAEFDFDGDGNGDDYTYCDSAGGFEYDPSNFLSYGQVTIDVRAADVDPQTGQYSFSDWVSISFTYEDPNNTNAPAAVSSVSLLNDTGTAGDNVTTDPTLTGVMTNDGGMDFVDAEFDFDGDGNPDDYTVVNLDGSFEYDPSSNISYGQVTINVRACEFDPNTGQYLYGDWVPISFTYEAPANNPATVSSVSLLNDTGTAGDNVTTDPTLTGMMTNDGSMDYVDAEFDFDGDGNPDDYTVVNLDGSFEYDPSSNISYGQVTINVRACEFDPNTGQYLYGDWVPISFTYEAPANNPATVSSVSLLNDTGTAGDNVTTDPTLTGMMTNDGSMDYVDAEFDFDGDGNPDDYTVVNLDGSFEYDPSSNISYGQVTINVRACEFDPKTGQYLYGDWVPISFTYKAPANNPATVSSVSLLNDTGMAGDNVTTDPTLTGMMTNDGSMDYVDAEFDFDGDGESGRLYDRQSPMASFAIRSLQQRSATGKSPSMSGPANLIRTPVNTFMVTGCP